MNSLVTRYCFLSVILLLAIFVGTGGTFPAQAQARVVLQINGDDDPLGDPNDEQDINDAGSSGGTYDDDFEDGYWGLPGAVWEAPIILIVPSWGQSVPVLRIFLLPESRLITGEIYAR